MKPVSQLGSRQKRRFNAASAGLGGEKKKKKKKEKKYEILSSAREEAICGSGGSLFCSSCLGFSG